MEGQLPSRALPSDIAPEVAALAGDQELRMLARMAAAGPLASSRAGIEGKPPGSLITPHQRGQLAQLGKPLLQALATGASGIGEGGHAARPPSGSSPIAGMPSDRHRIGEAPMASPPGASRVWERAPQSLWLGVSAAGMAL